MFCNDCFYIEQRLKSFLFRSQPTVELWQKDQPAGTKWTKEGGYTQVGKGWTDAGLEEMVTLCTFVDNDWRKNGKTFNTYYSDLLKEAEKAGRFLKRKSLVSTTQEDNEAKKRKMVPDDFDNNDDIDDDTNDDQNKENTNNTNPLEWAYIFYTLHNKKRYYFTYFDQYIFWEK